LAAVERPALDDDAALLPVEREERSVDVTGRLRHSRRPPVHPARVIDPREKPLQVRREERVHAIHANTTIQNQSVTRRLAEAKQVLSGVIWEERVAVLIGYNGTLRIQRTNKQTDRHDYVHLPSC